MMGFSYGYGFKTQKEAEKLKATLEARGHEVYIEKATTIKGLNFWVRDFGIKPLKKTLWQKIKAKLRK